MTTEEKLAKELEDARASIKALEAKNAEVIGINKRAKAEAEAAREAAEAAAEEKARTEKDVEALERTLTAKFEKTIKTLTDQLEQRTADLSTIQIDNAISKALVDNNVAAPYHEAVTALFKSQAKLDGADAKIGDALLSDHIKSYLATDVGKAFVAPPANTGGNAPGSSASSSTITKENFSMDALLKLANENPAEAKRVAQATGNGHLFE
ncbi:hypothetical protein [Brevundimonas sp. NPDC058933]|uniref:hypothetical protein n=1 Tax=Brevundimonas sp. NPDC058933 TaxID=3346673 RepID=UPI003BEED52B